MAIRAASGSDHDYGRELSQQLRVAIDAKLSIHCQRLASSGIHGRLASEYRAMNGIGPQLCRWHAVADERALQDAAYEIILAGAAQAIRERGRFLLVLAGGNTPRA